jgi:hypothetical protein
VTKDDFEQYKAGMIALAAVTSGGKTLDILTERAYWTVLEKVPGPIVFKALRLAMDGFEFFPSAADLLRLCDEAEADERGELALLAPSAAPVALLPDPDAQYRGEVQSWERPPTLYFCPTCQDSGFEQGLLCKLGHLCSSCQRGTHPYDHTYCRRCECMKAEDDAGKNPVIMAEIRRSRERLGLAPTKDKYSKPARSMRRYRQ